MDIGLGLKGLLAVSDKRLTPDLSTRAARCLRNKNRIIYHTRQMEVADRAPKVTHIL